MPWSIVRATQFHPFLASFSRYLRWCPVGTAPVSFRLQPVSTDVVVDRLIRAASEGAGERLGDIGAAWALTEWERAAYCLGVDSGEDPEVG